MALQYLKEVLQASHDETTGAKSYSYINNNLGAAYFPELKNQGTGIDPEKIQATLSGKSSVQNRTAGEKLQRPGLQWVQELLKGIHGAPDIHPVLNEGTCFRICPPCILQTHWEEGMTNQIKFF